MNLSRRVAIFNLHPGKSNLSQSNMTYKPVQVRNRVLGSAGRRAPTDKELKRILFWARESRNAERNELIFFMQLIGFRITETAMVTVDRVMWKSGQWRDEILLPAKMCKNNKANHVLFVNKRLRKAGDQYVKIRINKNHRTTGKLDEWRGLAPNSKLILAEGGRPFSLKSKPRVNDAGETVIYWAADSLQETFSEWCECAGLKGELSSHCGRKAFSSRLAKNKTTSQEDIIATLLRHNETDSIYNYVEESADISNSISKIYENL